MHAVLTGDLDAQIDRLLADEQFDFIGWEAEALLGKLAHSLVSPQRYMDESSRHDFFLDYLALVDEIGRTEWDIYRVYTDPDVEDPEAVAQVVSLALDFTAHAPEDMAACNATAAALMRWATPSRPTISFNAFVVAVSISKPMV